MSFLTWVAYSLGMKEDPMRLGKRLLQQKIHSQRELMTKGLEKGIGMKIDVGKTKVMRFTKGMRANLRIRVDKEELKQIDEFSYLGSVLSWDGRYTKEIWIRIALAKDAFVKKRELVTKGFHKGIRKRLVKSLEWSVLLYGCETWTLRKEDIKRQEAFEMSV